MFFIVVVRVSGVLKTTSPAKTRSKDVRKSFDGQVEKNLNSPPLTLLPLSMRVSGGLYLSKFLNRFSGEGERNERNVLENIGLFVIDIDGRMAAGTISDPEAWRIDRRRPFFFSLFLTGPSSRTAGARPEMQPPLSPPPLRRRSPSAVSVVRRRYRSRLVRGQYYALHRARIYYGHADHTHSTRV